MSAELLILVSTAVLAVVALCAAVISVRAVRTLREAPVAPPASTELAIVKRPTQMSPQAPAVLAPRVVEGRPIVPPTQQQVVATALGRPGVRLSVLAHGVAHEAQRLLRGQPVGLHEQAGQRRAGLVRGVAGARDGPRTGDRA